MRSEVSTGRAVAGLAFCAALLLLALPSSAEDAAVTVTGEVEAADYDENDEVIAVSIFDSEWGSILVAPGGKGAELLKHVGATVTATGKLKELEDDDSGYLYRITVASFTIDRTAEAEPDEDWDPDEEK